MSSHSSTRASDVGTILVTGSTGNIGAPLVKHLLVDGRKVRAIVQPGVTAPWAQHERLELVSLDLDDRKGLERAAKDAARVFMLVSPDPRQESWQSNIAHAARNTERVVKISAFDTGPDSPWTMGRWHYAGEQDLLEAEIPHVILRPQYFMQNLFRDEAALRAGRMRTFIPPERRCGMIDAQDVAEVAAALLVSDAHDGEILFPTGPSAIDDNDVARAIGAAVGGDLRVEYLDAAAALAAMAAAGIPDWLAADTLCICQEASPLVTDVVPRILGRPARTISDAAAARFARPVKSLS